MVFKKGFNFRTFTQGVRHWPWPQVGVIKGSRPSQKLTWLPLCLSQAWKNLLKSTRSFFENFYAFVTAIFEHNVDFYFNISPKVSNVICFTVYHTEADTWLKKMAMTSSVGGGDVGGASAPPKVLICRKSGKNPGKFGHRCFDAFVENWWNTWNTSDIALCLE